MLGMKLRVSWGWFGAVLVAAVLGAGCVQPTIESRKQERMMAYAALPPHQREAVDQGQIRVGMGQDAVYIAWGKPSEVLESEGPEGRIITWLYYGTGMQESRFWNYREVPQKDGRVVLERYLDREYNPQSYVRAEIRFARDKLISWRTLPKPAN